MSSVPVLADPLETESPLAILRWATTHSGRVAFGTGFGAEGCVLIDLIARNRLAIDIFTLDTGLLFPETYALWRQLEAHYGVTIRAVLAAQSVDEQSATHGPELWRRAPDRCCALRKLEPLHGALSGYQTWVTAIRRDQTAERVGTPIVGHDPRYAIVKVNPLATWSHEDVWSYLS